MGEMIKVLIVDDNSTVRQGLKALLASAADMEATGEAGNGQLAVDLAARQQPDVIIMDLSMPGMDGFDATRKALQVAPQSKVMILSNFGEREQVEAALQAGARGYLLKDAVSTNVVAAVRALHRGNTTFHPSIEETALSVLRSMEAASELTGAGEGDHHSDELPAAASCHPPHRP